jgi:LuxR family maltose regulon positive regulatory protein
LSQEDKDLRSFLKGIITSVQKVFPNLLHSINNLLEAPEMPPLKTITESLINELDEIDQEFILILDDYHLVNNDQINELVNQLLVFPPQNMHLVMMTRRDPLLNLTTLRAYSRINEIRMSDLCFTKNEIVLLFKNLVNIELDADTVSGLLNNTEGWITGLRLASLVLKPSDDVKQKLANIKGDMHMIADFLLTEVLLSQPEYLKKILIEISILDRFCAQIIDEVFNPDKSENAELNQGTEIIQRMVISNLFVIPLDSEMKWFRFHHFFQKLLQNQLKKQQTKKEIWEYHKLASRWFEKNNLIEEALRHIVLAEDFSSALTIVENHRYELMNTGQWNRLERWFKILPTEFIDKSPVLLVAKAFLLEYKGQIGEMIAHADQAKKLLNSFSDDYPYFNAVRGEISVLEGEVQIFSGEGNEAVDSSNKAISLLPEKAHHAWSYAIGEQVLAHQMAGDIDKGFKVINQLMNDHNLPEGLPLARMALWKCMAFMMEGDMKALKKPAIQSIEMGEKYKIYESVMFGRYFSGVAHYLLNELDEALLHLEAIALDPYAIRLIYFTHTAFLLAMIYIAQGKTSEALGMIKKLIALTPDTHEPFSVMSTVRAMQVDLLFRQGKIDEALKHKSHLENEFIPPIWFYYVPQITKAKIHLAENTPKSIEEGLKLLDSLEKSFRKSNRKTILVDVLALQAIVLDAQGKEDLAYEKLSQSLALAELGGMIRNFLDMGDYISSLLNKFNDQNREINFGKTVIHAFDEEINNRPITTTNKNLEEKLAYNSQLLSKRELDVLKLVELGFRNREISEKLHISYDTVKKHIYRMFIKCDVQNRISLLKKVKELDYLKADN